jgi:hypothetical protein
VRAKPGDDVRSNLHLIIDSMLKSRRWRLAHESVYLGGAVRDRTTPENGVKQCHPARRV